MRKLIIAIIIVAVVGLTFIILAAPDRESAPEFPLVEDEDYMTGLATNSVIGHDESYEIGGLFDGKTPDTLRIAFAAETEYIDSTLYVTLDGKRFKDSGDEMEDWHFMWDIKSDKGSVPDLRVFGLCPLLVYEGDLEGNGTDEFGVLFTWSLSACRGYDVFTFHEGEWRLLIPEVPTAESLRASGKELVRAGDYPGEVKVTMSDLDDPSSSCTYAPDRDTVWIATYETIKE